VPIILLGIIIPMIFVVLIAFGIFYIRKTIQIKYFKDKLVKASPIDDDLKFDELNEMQPYLNLNDDKNKLIELVE